MTIFRARGLRPFAFVSKKIPEPSVFRIDRMAQKRQVPRSKFFNSRRLGSSKLLDQDS